jgi:N-acetyl-gamma-glutamyl-phosphate reductase
MGDKAKIGLVGASGYAGAELLRILVSHPRTELGVLTADRKAGQPVGEVLPQFAPYVLPHLVNTDEVDWVGAQLDLVLCALPHATTQRVIKRILASTVATKVVDLSADFRLHDLAAYKQWYGQDHLAPELQQQAVYGLVEIYRQEIKAARLVASPGCYPTGAELPLVPLLKQRAILADEIIIDAKSGATGAGRALQESMLFAEVAEGVQAYAVGQHRHMAEFDQELSKAAGCPVVVSFTPHLLPINRGLLTTIYIRARDHRSPRDLHAILAAAYAHEPFIEVLPFGRTPHTRHVRGSNRLFVGVANDRVAPRAIIVSALDNLVKGAAGQAVQAMNLMLGFPETMGLELPTLSP